MSAFFAGWASQALPLFIVLWTYESLRQALRGNPKALFISARVFFVVSIVVALTMAILDIGRSFEDSMVTFLIVGVCCYFLARKEDFFKVAHYAEPPSRALRASLLKASLLNPPARIRQGRISMWMVPEEGVCTEDCKPEENELDDEMFKPGHATCDQVNCVKE